MLLDIQSVEFKNFLSFGNNWQKFDLESGLNLVIGKQKNSGTSNGSGKSCLLESIIFGLYGKVTKDINKDQVVNWKNKKKCEVKVTFMKGNDKYVIHRGIFPTILKLYKNDQEEDQISHNRDFQAELEKYVLGIDFDTFLSIAHYNATQSQSIFNVSKGAKRAFLEKLFGLELYSDILLKCNTKSSIISNKLSALQQELNFNERSISDLVKQNAGFSDEIESIDIDDIESQIKELKKQKNSCEKEVSTSSARILELQEKKLKVQEKLDNSKENSVNLNQQVYLLQDKIDNLKIVKIEFDEEEYDEIVNEKNNLSEKWKDFNLEELKDEIQKEKEKRDIIQLEVNNILRKISSIEGMIQTIPNYSKDDKSGLCPLCNTEVSIDHINAHIEGKKEKYDLEIEKYTLEEQTERKKLKDVKEHIQKLEDKEDSFESDSKRIQILSAKISKLDLEKQNVKQNKENKNEKIKLEEKIEKLKDKLNAEKDNHNKFSRMLSLIDVQLEELQEVSEKLIKLENDIEQKQIIIESKTSQIERLKNYITANKNKISDIKRNTSEFDKQEKKLKNILDYLDFIKKITKDEGVRTFAIQNTIPFLTTQVNKYLADSGVNFYLKLDSQLNVEVKGPGIINATFGSLSSGQQKVTNLAMLLAFLDLFKLRSPICTNILLLDEVLDSAVDSPTLTQMMSIITQKQQNENLKVFIVSHRKEINNIDEWNNIYKAEMDSGFTTITKVNQ